LLYAGATFEGTVTWCTSLPGDSQALAPGFGRSLEQFEKDSLKWEKLVKEIVQKWKIASFREPTKT
jgi:hypothetical protein